MLGAIRGRLTYANVMASVALFVALGGVSYAAVSLPDNSVGTKQLRQRSVTQGKLAVRSVGARQLRRRSVTKRALSTWIRGQLARRSAPGPKGAPGPQGPAGPRGPGAVAVRYSAAAAPTPAPVKVLDTGGLTINVSCDVGAGTTTLNFSVRSATAATLHETVTVDSGPDLTNPLPADFTGNLQIDFPAGVTLQTGGPSATVGYSRVAVQGIFSSPNTTIDLQLFALVNADAGRCSINGVATPA